MIRAVILDFDGVINDSAQPGRHRIIQIVKDAGYAIPLDIREKLKLNWGTHGTKLIEECFGVSSAIACKLYRQWEAIDAKKFFPLVRGAKTVLRKLEKMRMRGLRTCLLTSRNRENLFDVLIHFDLVPYFYFIQAKDDWSFVKPDPHAFCFLLNKLARENVHAEECMYVGDTPVDFRVALQRDICCVNVLTGLHTRVDFLKIGQRKENIIHSMADLPKWLKKYGN